VHQVIVSKAQQPGADSAWFIEIASSRRFSQ
jgi:hypothetical protein